MPPLSDAGLLYLGVTCLLGILVAIFLKRSENFGLPYPSGPKGLPLFKNLFDIPTSLEHVTYAQWGKEHGDIVHVGVLDKHMVVLNSVKAAVELLDQKSAIYSDRPYLPMLHDKDLIDANYAFSTMFYSRRWKRHRRLFTQYINPTIMAQQFTGKQIAAAYSLLRLLLSKPNSLKEALSLTSARIIFGVTHGHELQGFDDPLLKLAEESAILTAEGAKPKYLVNMFPALKCIPSWCPGNQFKGLAKKAHELNCRLIEEGYETTKKSLSSGNYTPSFIQTALTELTDGHDPELVGEIKDVAAQAYGAGVDTTTAAMQFLVLKLVLHAEVQKRAQEELDSVLGSPESPTFRLPTYEDRPYLPYIEALVKETLRLFPPLPIGVPHAVMEDDIYRGRRIPKGSIVIANAWGMNRDENVYSEPDRFHPERFLATDSKPAEADPVATFGFGRRICPGRFLAESSLWIEAACLLAAFNFTPEKDENGNEVDIRFAEVPEPHFILQPQKFSCSITPRAKHAETVIRETECHDN